MKLRLATFGFSLIEVILAVGIFALTVPTTLALLAALGRQGTTSAEVRIAQRLPGSVRLELARLAEASLEDLAAAAPVMTSPPEPGLALVATRDGARLHASEYLPPAAVLALADQYFLIECWRFGEEPLQFDSDKAYLALYVRVCWPYRLADGMTTESQARSATTFTVVLNR
jgi:hypothetical protein